MDLRAKTDRSPQSRQIVKLDTVSGVSMEDSTGATSYSRTLPTWGMLTVAMQCQLPDSVTRT
jgi:hypothetical protein